MFPSLVEDSHVMVCTELDTKLALPIMMGHDTPTRHELSSFRQGQLVESMLLFPGCFLRAGRLSLQDIGCWFRIRLSCFGDSLVRHL